MHNTSIAWTCGYCGRPIVGGFCSAGGQFFHPECTRGPGYIPERFAPLPDADLRRDVEDLKRRVDKLEASPLSGPRLG